MKSSNLRNWSFANASRLLPSEGLLILPRKCEGPLSWKTYDINTYGVRCQLNQLARTAERPEAFRKLNLVAVFQYEIEQSCSTCTSLGQSVGFELHHQIRPTTSKDFLCPCQDP